MKAKWAAFKAWCIAKWIATKEWVLGAKI